MRTQSVIEKNLRDKVQHYFQFLTKQSCPFTRFLYFQSTEYDARNFIDRKI